MKFKDVWDMRSSTLKRFIRQPRFDEHMELHRLDCLSSNRALESYEFVRKVLDQTPDEQIRPPHLLTGEDLKRMGFSPGPVFREILGTVEDAQLEGELTSVEAAEDFVQRRFGNRHPKVQG